MSVNTLEEVHPADLARLFPELEPAGALKALAEVLSLVDGRKRQLSLSEMAPVRGLSLYAPARREAQALMTDYFRPACLRVALAGSLRRRRPVVGDIEICCIADQSAGLWGAGTGPSLLTEKLLRDPPGTLEKGQPEGGKYLRYRLPSGVALDLFVCTRENWGWNYTVRTGSAEFSKLLVERARDLGFTIKSGEFIDTATGVIVLPKEEADVFHLLQLEPIEPWDRAGRESLRLLKPKPVEAPPAEPVKRARGWREDVRVQQALQDSVDGTARRMMEAEVREEQARQLEAWQ